MILNQKDGKLVIEKIYMIESYSSIKYCKHCNNNQKTLELEHNF